MKKFALSISRQYGCGARETGELIAKHTGAKYYDRALLARIAAEDGINPDLLDYYDEKPVNSFLYTASTEGISMTFSNLQMPMDERVFQATAKAIRSAADESSCIIVGRCGDYVLRERPELVTVFLHADLESRMQRAIHVYGMAEKGCREKIQKIDRRRAQYHSFFSCQKWGTGDGYDLNIDVSKLGAEGTAKLIEDYLRLRGFLD